MKYRFVLRDFRLPDFGRLAAISPILFAFLFSGLKSASAQTSYWTANASLGGSYQTTDGDTLTKQKFLLPTFGASASYHLSITKGGTLRVSLGYQNRGGVSSVDAVVDRTTGKSLGEYRVNSRDHFVSNDIGFQYTPQYLKVFGLLPFFALAVRNDVYLLSNSKIRSNDAYFKPESTRLEWYRNRHHKPYVVGLVANAGLHYEDWMLGLEYYHQVLGSFYIPGTVKANYTQINTRSIHLSIGYKF